MLYGPGHKPLSVRGKFISTLLYKERAVQQPVYVVEGLQKDLLGLPAITGLNLAVRVDTAQTPNPALSSSIRKSLEERLGEKYPRIFKGLGNLGDPYFIKLCDDAQPLAIYTPRSVPLPLRDKVKEELERMENLGVISRVEEPTPWCAGIVAVPKSRGDVRICVDLRHLNQIVMREVHPLPKVEEQLTGAKLFSKLDANSGFWQIPLAEESRLLTTFITPFGRYCFNKLPFGIASAPEHFQKRMSRILEGLEGVVYLEHGQSPSQ